MTPNQIKTARETLGLTQAQLGAMLDTDGQTIRRMEMPEDASTHRKPAVRMIRLIQAYLDGYRPRDWPQQITAASHPVDVLETILTDQILGRGLSDEERQTLATWRAHCDETVKAQ